MAIKPPDETSVRYAYGDNAAALQRLRLLADVFRPTTEALLGQVEDEEPEVILDLGCGPGETTALLHRRFPEAAVLGLDTSAQFVEVARRASPAGVSFIADDVRTVPLAGGPADLIYARLLLAHLPGPERIVRAWLTQLRSGGVLLLEEVEGITTGDPLFERYLRVATSVLRARGTELFVGRALARMSLPAGVSLATSAVATLRPPVADVARMFALNLKTLREDEIVKATFKEDQLDELAADLDRRAKDGTGGPVTWEMRQMVLRREQESLAEL